MNNDFQSSHLLDSPESYINRELSWLSFNDRVIDEAEDSSNPLLERLKFLSIAASNLDEFFMVRVAGLRDQVRLGFDKPDNKSGMTPAQQLDAISVRTHAMIGRMYRTVQRSFWPELQAEGIIFRGEHELTGEQQTFVEAYFEEKVYPVLTPMAVDASHPFPMLLNRSLNLAVLLEEIDPEEQEDGPLFAVVQVPTLFSRVIELPSPDEKRHFILLEELIRMNISELFQGFTVLEVRPFRITRNADLTIHEDETEDLLEAIEAELKRRKMGAAVRLGVDSQMSEYLKEMLQESLELQPTDLYQVEGPLDVTFFSSLYGMAGYDHLRFPPQKPQPVKEFQEGKGIFYMISQKDFILHHPYEFFDPVVEFVEQAAVDPQVLAIKQTLYRVSGDSPIVHALARAAENGKQVTVLLELKARFDEENNITWARRLEKAGCHVIYGLYQLKTHSKIILVVRSEAGSIKRFVHMSTGNYNDLTARYYTDIGMFTAREEFGVDASAFFNYLSGYSVTPDWNVLSTAPDGLRDRFVELIRRETEHHLAGEKGRIIAKINSLTDKLIMQELYRASMAGVEIDLIVRGICCLRPGVPGLSENIRVRSIVGRYLEHSRLFYFANGGDEEVYLSSSDWMTRNMMGRVELLFPALQEDVRNRIKNILYVMLQDNVKARELLPDGHYQYVRNTQPPLDSQVFFYQQAYRKAHSESLTTPAKKIMPIHRVEDTTRS